MSRVRSPEIHTREFTPTPVGDFGEIRKDVAHRLFRDPSYGVFDAMSEMTTAAEGYINDLSEQYPGNRLWVGGSLGRGEMLPNSDIDLFVVHDRRDYQESDIRVDGVDKFELGQIDLKSLGDLLDYSLVDANRFIDGRRVGHTPAPEVERMILETSTSDRQLANNISEYFFYRYFDFPNKTTPMGPNLKYSTGSSRDTIFYNMIARMWSGDFPAVRGSQPELAQVMAQAEEKYGVRAPYEAVNLLFTVKNAAISVYDKTGDSRNRYVSPISLEAIYEFGKDKFQAWGIKDAAQFIGTYGAARRELELKVDDLFTKALSEHGAASDLNTLLALPKDQLPDTVVDMIINGTEHPHSVNSFGAWLTNMDNPSAQDMQRIAEALMTKPLDQSWGGLMAVACSASTDDQTLSKLADWLYTNEKGAYLTKLVSRNPAASDQTRAKAKQNYRDKEIIV